MPSREPSMHTSPVKCGSPGSANFQLTFAYKVGWSCHSTDGVSNQSSRPEEVPGRASGHFLPGGIGCFAANMSKNFVLASIIPVVGSAWCLVTSLTLVFLCPADVIEVFLCPGAMEHCLPCCMGPWSFSNSFECLPGCLYQWPWSQLCSARVLAAPLLPVHSVQIAMQHALHILWALLLERQMEAFSGSEGVPCWPCPACLTNGHPCGTCWSLDLPPGSDSRELPSPGSLELSILYLAIPDCTGPFCHWRTQHFKHRVCLCHGQLERQ